MPEKMPELIDRQDTLEKIKTLCKAYMLHETVGMGGLSVIRLCREIVEKQPTIEPEIRRGRWIFVGEETLHDGWTYRKHKCTECDFVTVEAKNFCQNCGAKMDGCAEK